jgi:polysaccharide export outer membrane protein
MRRLVALAVVAVLFAPVGLAAQAPPPEASPQATTPPAPQRPPAAGGVPVGADFTIGPEDVLGVVFWRDQDMSQDVTVRPDGMITLPLIRDIKAAGLKPNELADRIQEAAKEYIAEPAVTVVVRQMNSRKVFITGEVFKPGSYPLTSSMTVMQLIAVAGGLTEFADGKKISVMRVEGGESRTYEFNYKDVARGKKQEQNLVLKPGDTVVVPEG